MAFRNSKPPRHPIKQHKNIQVTSGTHITSAQSAPAQSSTVAVPKECAVAPQTAPYAGKRKTTSSVYTWDVLPPPEMRLKTEAQSYTAKPELRAVKSVGEISPLNLPQSQHERDSEELVECVQNMSAGEKN